MNLTQFKEAVILAMPDYVIKEDKDELGNCVIILDATENAGIKVYFNEVVSNNAQKTIEIITRTFEKYYRDKRATENC